MLASLILNSAFAGLKMAHLLEITAAFEHLYNFILLNCRI
jgi:hypothetical protein